MVLIQKNVSIAEELPEVTAVLSTQVIFPDQTQVESHLESLQANSTTYQAVLRELHTRKMKVAGTGIAPTSWYVKDSAVTGEKVRAATFVQDLGSGNGTDSGLIGVVVEGVDEKGRPVRQETWEIVEKPSGAGVDPSCDCASWTLASHLLTRTLLVAPSRPGRSSWPGRHRWPRTWHPHRRHGCRAESAARVAALWRRV